MPAKRLRHLHATLFALALALTPPMAGCGVPPESRGPQRHEAQPGQTPRRGGTLHRRLASYPAHLDLLFIGGSLVEWDVSLLLHEELLGTSQDLQIDLEHSLARSAEPAEDHRSVRIELKPDLHWHDGAPLTVDDFLFAYQLLSSDTLRGEIHGRIHPDVSGLKKLGDDAMTVYFGKPLAEWRGPANLPPLPRHLIQPELALAEKEGRSWNPRESIVAREPLGAGPYRLVTRREGEGLVLERWKAYPGPSPAIERVVFHVIPDASAAINAFLAGDIDETWIGADKLASPSLRSQLESRGRILSGGSWATDLIFWNLRRPPFDQIAVRRALAHAVRIDEIIETLWGGRAMAAAGWFPPGCPGFDGNANAPGHDLATAAELLASAGYTRISLGAPWTRDGETLEFEMIHPASDTASMMAAAIQADLAELGVAVSLRPLEIATLRERIRTRDFDALLVHYGVADSPDKSARLWVSREAPSGVNISGLRDAEIDRLFDRAARSFDSSERRALFEAVNARLAALSPALFLWHPERSYVVAHRVRGFATSPRGPYAFYPGQRAWWLTNATEEDNP